MDYVICSEPSTKGQSGSALKQRCEKDNWAIDWDGHGAGVGAGAGPGVGRRNVIKCENPLKAENQTNFIEYQINMFIKMRTLN